MRHETEPKTLQSAIVYFANPDNCLNYLIERRWPEGVTCPRCGSDNIKFMASRRVWQCNARHAQAQFSIKVGTIFEDSPIGLRLALQGENSGKLSGNVEVDETYIGGKARNMHRSALARRVAEFATPRTGRNQTTGKVAVMGLLERHGEVRTMVVGGTKRSHLQREVYNHIEQGSTVYTDALRSYNALENDFTHKVINHAERYVDGQVHTNGVENFWSLLKRGINGTYVSVEPFHLFRYLDEQSFRFNNRKANDAYRFDLAVSQIVGKRLTYSQLTGKSDADRKKPC